ncbi:MCE family protein [Streptomyces polyrhachis]|uniref:MCE family protein n=1 Tax=Streptomyces polyrhachis TaxID=1282885 RepID=A0ABW2GGA0_9ACTN
MWRRRAGGVAYLVVPLLLIVLSLAIYNKQFTPADTVTVLTGPVGNEMRVGADVKLRGVIIGEVRKIDTNGDQARMVLAIKPGALKNVPANVTAQMLPTTLFGQRYVALVSPAAPDAVPLAPNATIPQNRSYNAIELEETLDNLMPLLTAVQPAKLAATLSAVSTALNGHGKEIGTAITTLDAYLKKFNPHLPELNEDLKQFVGVSNTYAEAAPDIVDALKAATTTTATLAQQRAKLSSLYTSVTVSSQDLDTWLRGNRDNLIQLTSTARPTLELMARYSPSFPCTLATVANFVPAMDRALGKGTDRPGLRVNVTVEPSRGAYQPGRDAPVYRANSGPACYSVPFNGTGRPAGERRSAPEVTGQTLTRVDGGLGLPNSPQENALVNELLAAQAPAAADTLPNWSSLLAGPAFRGAEVTLR